MQQCWIRLSHTLYFHRISSHRSVSRISSHCFISRRHMSSIETSSIATSCTLASSTSSTSAASSSTSSSTPIWSISPSLPYSQLLELVAPAAALLKADQVVAFPTETVYGLGGNAFSTPAIDRIYAAKGRPSDNPLIVHVASLEQATSIVTHIPQRIHLLIEKFWPGPLTLILPAKGPISSRVTAGLSTVAIRMPSHPIARALIESSSLPIAAPSANTSGRPSPTLALHVYHDLNGRIAGIIDGGATEDGVESTVIDCTEIDSHGHIIICRPGSITREMLETVLGKGHVHMDPSIMNGDVAHSMIGKSTSTETSTSTSTSTETSTETSTSTDTIRHIINNEDTTITAPRAPGMKYTHYAPRAPLTILDGDDEFIQSHIDAAYAQGKRIGMLTTSEKSTTWNHITSLQICGSRASLSSVAHHLYDCLRSFDDVEPHLDIIYSECFNGDGISDAIMNRLIKAAGKRVIRQEKKSET